MYEVLQDTYSHFIHIPSKDRGKFIASKYPVSQAEIRLYERENAIRAEVLEFSIHGASIHRACIDLNNDSSIKLVSSNEAAQTTIFLGDLPAVVTVVKQQFSPFQNMHKVDQIARNSFDILPVRRGEGGRDRDNNDRGGGYYEGSIDFKNGPDGTEWSVSGKAGYEDSRGNYVEGNISRNDRGETSGRARAGHDDNDK